MTARKKSEADIGKLIRGIGGDWKKFEDRRYCPHCRQLIYRVDNQPYDGLGVLRGQTFPIEIKSAKLSFPFADIKEHQRAGLTDWQKKHGATAWFALQMGTGKAGSKDSNLPRRLWLVPWDIWLSYEEWVRETADQVSLPYDWHYGRMRKIITEHEMGAVQVLQDHELMWREGEWVLPDDHLFRLIYLPGERYDEQ